MVLNPCSEDELKYSTPWVVATAWARVVVTKPCISSAGAPGYSVVTVITALSILGCWRRGRSISARMPTRAISKAKASVSTGRRMKMSVKAMAVYSFLPV
ncbi:hypothetical protein D3C81_1503940 [compost metagenome]